MSKKRNKSERVFTIREINEACKEVSKMNPNEFKSKSYEELLADKGLLDFRYGSVIHKAAEMWLKANSERIKLMESKLSNNGRLTDIKPLTLKRRGFDFAQPDKLHESLKANSMKDIEVKEVIVSRLAKRGQGMHQGDPVRSILQVYEKSGELIAERDPELEALPKTVDGLRNFFENGEPLNTKSAFQHELRVAMRYLYVKSIRIDHKGDAVPIDKIEFAMGLVRKLGFIDWIENTHNKECSPDLIIKTNP